MVAGKVIDALKPYAGKGHFLGSGNAQARLV